MNKERHPRENRTEKKEEGKEGSLLIHPLHPFPPSSGRVNRVRPSRGRFHLPALLVPRHSGRFHLPPYPSHRHPTLGSSRTRDGVRVRLTSFPRLSPVRSLMPGLPHSLLTALTREPATAVGSHLLPHGRGSTRPAALNGERRGPSPEETRRNRARVPRLVVMSPPCARLIPPPRDTTVGSGVR